MTRIQPFILLVAFIVGFQPMATAQFTDDFTDGDFTQNPQWTGVTNHFQVNASSELQLNAPAVTATSHLVTASNAIGNAQYDFYVRLAFNPSTSNYANVYLVSSDSNLSAALQGYYVRIGGASGTTDDVSLYYQNGTTATKIIDGVDGTVATNPELNVRVTRTMAGAWELLIDVGATGNYVSQGTVSHSLATVSNYFGVFCKYTSTRSDKFFFDNFVVTGTPIMDVDPPVVDSVVAQNLTEVTVYFNEVVELNSSQNTSNYSLDNGFGNPVSALRNSNDSTKVDLLYPPLNNNTNYNLTVQNIADASGNVLVSQVKGFSINVPVPANYGDVVINEIFPDPSPQVGLPNAEFIELHNVTSQPINLANWKYADASTQVSLPTFNLASNAHVILCKLADTALFQSYGAVVGLSSWPSLNNSADQLGLRDANNALIDSVAYTDSWYNDSGKKGGGWTLERINPTLICSDASNWSASNSSSGGTPGIVNSIYANVPDTAKPMVSMVNVVNDSQLFVQFSKPLNISAVGPQNFSLNNGISVTQLQANGFAEVQLTVQPNLDSATVYELAITGIEGCNQTQMNDTVITTAIGLKPQAYQLVFTEIYPAPAASNIYLPEAEFVEIYNTTNHPINTWGVEFSDRSTSVALPNNVLLPGEYAILCEDVNAERLATYGKVIALSSWPSLNNSSDLISLTAAQVIDAVLYNDSWYRDDAKKTTGWTMELINTEKPCLGAINWTGSTDQKQGTPGQQNSVFNLNYGVAFAVQSVNVVALNQVEVNFTQNIDWFNVSAANFSFSPSVDVDSVTVNNEQLNSIRLFLNQDLGNAVYEVTVSDVTSCSGTGLSGDSVFAVQLPQLQNMLINEVLFNPRTNGADFVELYNTTAQPIDLKNWQLLYFNSAGDSAYKPVTETSVVIASGSFAVLSKDTANIQYEYPNLGTGVYIQTSLPTYSNAQGHVIVLNQLGQLADEFAYNEDMHLALIRDPKGVSLERVNYALGPNSASNFNSAASTAGYATPGLKNSQLVTSGTVNGEVSVNPKTFSPNNDGYKDVCEINYAFNEPNYLATVTVHTAEGQLISTLANNVSLGTQGSFIWKGTADDGQVQATGMYLVVFRVNDLNNNLQVFKNVVVLAQP